ncbi:FlxA-like family protein [Shewanella intestini]|uniref:FlxA-like protein n=1 Tax=Shewanella intestini TaxID=2017544 RepID=A0ABS5I4Z9_9GAMM|nr:MULTISPECIES: FlxA-like family protein [Shewanella]MBR9728440.1 hypothetical protein [Shewanella intestini]MRG36782.1 hypothetical protein [Shewanella sp. XMDDZSB0408]
MNISGVRSVGSTQPNIQTAHISAKKDSPSSAPADGPNTESSSVSISDDAKSKLSSELGATMHKNNEGAKAQGGMVSAAANTDKRSDTEKKIDELKEQIKELQKQRQTLANDKSDEAQEQRKQIDMQIQMLNTQIVTLLKSAEKQAST